MSDFIEQVNDANTAEEMRSEINRLRQYDPIVRNVMDTADYNGMSSEDRFTILAYNALKQNAKLRELTIEWNRVTPNQPMIIDSDNIIDRGKKNATKKSR